MSTPPPRQAARRGGAEPHGPCSPACIPGTRCPNRHAGVTARRGIPRRMRPGESSWGGSVSLLTKKEAAVELPCSDSKVTRLLADGSLAFIKIGRRVLIQRSALEQFVKRCARKTVRDLALDGARGRKAD